jgi:hypothetical protein
MKLLLVTYALRNNFKDYTSFHVTVRGNALNWMQFIEHTYVVSTAHDADSFSKQLLPHMEPTDSLLVAEIQPHQFQGWLPQAAWDWLNSTSNVISPLNQITSLWPSLPRLTK